jgi:ESCRT-I complex subunit TSG101
LRIISPKESGGVEIKCEKTIKSCSAVQIPVFVALVEASNFIFSMVTDARVSRQLARLGGVYRDPARVNRDASSLLKSSVGSHLQPISAVYADDSGDTQTVLVLQGTIAIHFRGNTYQLLVDMYLVPGYPNRPPVCYVRLAPNMYLKENHRHVGSDGKVYMPYLHEWRPGTHNLVEMTVAMSSVFSADPPVFSRPAPAPAASAVVLTTTQPPAYLSTSIPSTAASATTSYTPHQQQQQPAWISQQEQLEAMMAREAAEANAAAEAARRAEQEEREQEERQKAVKAYEEAQLKQVKAAVTAKIQTHCREQAALTKQLVKEDRIDQQRLLSTHPETIEAQIKVFQTKKADFERKHTVVAARTAEIQDWLQQHENNKKGVVQQKSIDDICVPETAIHRQMLDLAAENASISDALYFLDRALYKDQLTVTEHLRQVRKLAKQQFLVRAHLLKIQQSQLAR